MLNDIGEFVFGWPDHEFSVDTKESSFMNINVDLVVAMPCSFISVDLRDAVGDRLFLSNTRGRGPGIRRDGTKFDVGQATTLKAHSQALSARQAVAQSRNSRGFFSTMFQWANPEPYMPRYKHEPDARGCRVKKVTANLHITTLGHGYASHEHVDHSLMNLSHVITEFSFGPYFPDNQQPLDNSLEITHDPFVAYQYFLHVVPTTYIAPRSAPLHTNQYSVTHYTRVLDHHSGTPGIFFKTIGIVQLIIRMVGVIGGVFVTTAAVSAFVDNSDDEIPPAVASASALKTSLVVSASLTKRARPGSGRLIPQGNGWSWKARPAAPCPTLGRGARGYPGSPAARRIRLAAWHAWFGPPPMSGRTPGVGSPRPQSIGSVPMPGTPQYGIFPPTPSPGQGFNIPPPPSGKRLSTGSPGADKKKDD
ncbi:DUF1692-domain-containing protein [Mycena olivaceomarginata]|nr:DUF1692-domain-containing protein [Mycena olivaceomarginata]